MEFGSLPASSCFGCVWFCKRVIFTCGLVCRSSGCRVGVYGSVSESFSLVVWFVVLLAAV